MDVHLSFFPVFPPNRIEIHKTCRWKPPPLGVGSMTKRKSLSYVVYIQTSNLLFWRYTTACTVIEVNDVVALWTAKRSNDGRVSESLLYFCMTNKKCMNIKIEKFKIKIRRWFL